MATTASRVVSKLPLAFTRQSGGNPTKLPIPFGADVPVVVKRRMMPVACGSVVISPAHHQANLAHVVRHGKAVDKALPVRSSAVVTVAGCQSQIWQALLALWQCGAVKSQPTLSLAVCQSTQSAALLAFHRCLYQPLQATQTYHRCLSAQSAAVVGFYRCVHQRLQSAVTQSYCDKVLTKGKSAVHCRRQVISPAVPVPCRYYPIPEPPPPPPIDDYACGIRPHAKVIPLSFKYRKTPHDAAMLPLPFACSRPENLIPIKKGYIMQNTITLTIDNVPIQLLSASIKTDTSSYCWQVSLNIPPDDFKQINSNKPRGQEPLIRLTINGQLFVFIAEEYSLTRKFIGNFYTVTGRSVTARLGEDYAKPQTGIMSQQLYARQIADAQLTGLSVAVATWQIVDWLVPANAYDVTNKSPIAVIADIAQAAGGFVETHPYQAKIHIKKRYKAPAWEIAAQTPDATIPASVITQITGKRQAQPRANAVRLLSQTNGGHVYRQLEDRSQEAPVVNHPLFTDSTVMLPAGTALLSQTGNHQEEAVTLPWSVEQQIPLASLGSIWRVNDGESIWQGIIKGVSVDLGVDNQAPTVMQTVTIDRYLDQ